MEPAYIRARARWNSRLPSAEAGETLFHTVDIFCSIVKADDRLRALCEPPQRQHGKLHDAGRIVIAPTAVSPPYFNRLVLKLMDSALSVNCMINGASPSARHGKDKFLLRAQVAEPYPQGTMRSGQKTQNPDTGNTL